MALFPTTAIENIGFSPAVFTGYSIERTKELTKFVNSGILQADPVLENWVNGVAGGGGGGLLLTQPTWNDLDSSVEERVGSDAQAPYYQDPAAVFSLLEPQIITAHVEQAVRVQRNMHWSVASLTQSVSASSPSILEVVGSLTGTYWARRFQRFVLAILAGVVADNDLAPNGTDTHTQGDLTVDISGGSFVNGITNFNADALNDTLQTLGDADNQITNLAVHSAVRNRMRKNNLIEFEKDSEGNPLFETFYGLRLTVDDGMPQSGQIYDSYLFGPGFLRFAMAPAPNALTREFHNHGGNGQGVDELWNRVAWCVHPMGHQFVGSIGTDTAGPTNAVLDDAASWSRSAQTRKNIPFAVLRTREA
jgi:hypothetical protein